MENRSKHLFACVISWNLFSIFLSLHFCEQVFSKGTMDAFILRSIYPKLSQCLAEFIINPHQQHLGMKPQKYQFSLLSFFCSSPVRYGVLLKGLCHGYLFYFVFNAIYASLFVMKLDKLPVNDKITSFVSNKVCLQSIISIFSNNNNELWKIVRLKKKNNCNPFQSSSSFSISASFCICCAIYTFF